MKIEIIRNNNYTHSPHGRCDFLIAPLAERIKYSIFYHRIILNIACKKYPHTDKKLNFQCHKFQEKSRKMLEFRTKNRSKPRLLLEFTRVTNVSQTCHKYVTNVSQISHKYVTKKAVFTQSCDFCRGRITIESTTITEYQIMPLL